MISFLLWFTVGVLIPLMLSWGTTAIGNTLSNRRLAEAEATPAVDEKGFRAEYDPHFVRSLEVEQGTPDGLLTTCDDEGCMTCQSRTIELADSKIDIGLDAFSFDSIMEAVQVDVRAVKKEIARREKALKEEEILSQAHDPNNFRPQHVPSRANVEIVNNAAEGVVIIWSWDNKSWRKPLKGFQLTEKGIQLSRIRTDKPSPKKGSYGMYEEEVRKYMDLEKRMSYYYAR